jgi:hypothetical protein
MGRGANSALAAALPTGSEARSRSRLSASDFARFQTEEALSSPVGYGRLSGDALFGSESFAVWMSRYLSWLGYVSNQPVGGRQLENALTNGLFHGQGRAAALTETGRAGADILLTDAVDLAAQELRQLPVSERVGISVKSDHSASYDIEKSFEISHLCSCPFSSYEPLDRDSLRRVVEEGLRHVIEHRQDYQRLVALCSAPDHFPDRPSDPALRCDLWEAPLETVIDPIAHLDPDGFIDRQGSGRLTQRVFADGQWTGTLTLLPRAGRIILHRVQTAACQLHGSYWMVPPPEAGIAGVGEAPVSSR